MGHNCTVKHSDYNSDNLYTWCTNCGNYGIHGAMKTALVDLEIKPKDVMLAFDIGCNGNGNDKINGYRFHGLHGRVIPFACGAAIANRNMTVLASAGDGATLGEGINHLVHAIRANYNITFLLHNNENYALTTGQASPTTPEGVPMNSSPHGVTSEPMNVADFILSLKPSFVARAYSGNATQLAELIKTGINHQGFSFIEIMQECPSYNHFMDHKWFLERIYDINSISEYDIHDLGMAKTVAADLNDKLATGVLYVNNEKPVFYDRHHYRNDNKTELVDEVKHYDISSFLEKYQ